mgnify:CR=1 FL=1
MWVMDPYTTQVLVDLGSSLAVLAAKGTASAVATKVKAIRGDKDAASVRAAYDELLEERSEALRIAQTYKAELERVQICDDDSQGLDATIARVLEIFASMQSDGEEPSSPNATAMALGQFRQLISADTLRTMQLLGFNYKAAIDEPLTELCANKIKQFGSGSNAKRPSQSRR